MSEEFTPRSRVRWLAPSVLAGTVKPLLLSGLFARFSDRREVEAVLPQGVIDLSDGDELWVDYVADTGDGFDATATVASLLAPEVLTVDGHRTEAGALLVLGGDEVYPYASIEAYKDRFIGPFRAMLPCADPGRLTVALPGNHDWYDGLTAFLQVFCGGQWIGGWKTVQRRSYFACKLPNRWWLWGIDIQLETYIDHPQVEHFKAAAEQIQEGDSIILCWAVPSWVEAGEDRPQAYDTLDYFQRNVVPDRAHLRLSLTGDSHHYSRYQGPNGEHKITAGLGGAFQSATHHLPNELLLPAQVKGDPPIPFAQRAVYPPAATSSAQRWGVLKSIYANDRFAILPAVAYAGLALGLTRSRRRQATTAVAGAAVTAACVAFSKPDTRRDWGPGLAHGAAHVTAALTVASALRAHMTRRLPVVAGAAAAGAAVGPFLFGLYLVAADRIGLFGRNTNELFAAQAIEDHKGFLRLHLRPDGGITVYPIKVDEVSRWVPDGTWDAPPGAPRFRPVTAPAPSLIEPPVEVTPTP
ncbi:MAG: metallophosphoesterase [Acidimicrobiales bacterium]